MNQKPVDDKELEKLIVETIEKSLKSFGFITAERKCYTPKYGEGAFTIENWDAKTVGMFVAQDAEKALNAHYQKKYLGLLPKKSKPSHKLKDADWKQFKNPKLSEEQYNMWVRGRNQAIDEALANMVGE